MSDVATLAKYEPATLADAERLADKLARSGLVPDSVRGKPADLLVIMLTGHELGLQTMQALRGISVINGRPVMSADLAVSLVKRNPACTYFKLIASDEKAATYETERKGEGKTRLSFTIQQAFEAGLSGRGPWKSYPAAMLRARCALALARAVYPDLLLGVYETDEGEDIRQGLSRSAANDAQPEMPAPSVSVETKAPEAPKPFLEDAQIVEEPPFASATPPAITEEQALAAIAADHTITSLRTLGKSFQGTPAATTKVQNAWAARMASLRKGGGR